MEFLRGEQHVIRFRLPRAGDLLQHLQETRAAILHLRRPVGAAEEGLALRCEKNIQRPAARAGHGLHEGHVNLVHVRALLAVHLDAHKILVEKLRQLLALKRFALHHMAPMARRVADAQEDGLVLAPRLLEGLLAPREPVHRIVRVLEQVGRLLLRETVGVLVFLNGNVRGGDIGGIHGDGRVPLLTGREREQQARAESRDDDGSEHPRTIRRRPNAGKKVSTPSFGSRRHEESLINGCDVLALELISDS